MTVADDSNAWDQDGSPAAATPDPPSSSNSLEPTFSSPPSSPPLSAPSIKIAPPLPDFPQVDSPIDSFDDFPADQPPEASRPAEEHVEDDDGFDDFDDPTGPSAGDAFGGDDDFGDFGDFDEGGEVQVGESFDEMYLKETPSPQPFVPPQSSLPLLNLSPLPDPSTLASLIQEILTPVFPDLAADAQLSAEEVRELRDVPGLGQVLVDRSGRELYASLTSPPELAPLDWTRSRVRREHLINLGVPFNLDEVTSSKAPSLPPLRIITNTPARPVSTPPVDRGTGSGPRRANTTGGSSLAPRRAGPNQGVKSGSTTPRSVGPAGDVDLGARGRREKTYGLGKKPEMEVEKARELLDVAPDSLSLMSLVSLEALQQDLTRATSSASTLLSYLLQLRDAQQNESLVSNGMIADLVMNAQKAALGAKTSGGGWRRSVGARSPGGS